MDKTSFHAIQNRLNSHMSGLDALRGVAVIWVVWHNCTDNFELEGLLAKILAFLTNSGWLGVQLFFVLSGFLITGLLLDAKGTKNQIRTFYFRRILRIFPLYYATLIFCFIILPQFDIEYVEFTKSQDNQIWFWLYLNNWTAPFISVGMLTHLWSLAVEEQFYLFWPWLVLGLSRSKLAYCCIFLVISAIIFRYIATYALPFLNENNAAYTFTIARWDSLALGALLAIFMRDKKSLQFLMRYGQRLTLSLVCTCAGIVLITQNFAAVGPGNIALNQTFAAALFTMLLFYTVMPSSPSTAWLGPIFRSKFLNTIGKYSYAIYIFHGIIKHLWRNTYVISTTEYTGIQLWLVNLYNVGIIFIISLLLAMISWRLLEHPFLKLKHKPPKEGHTKTSSV